MSAKPAPEPTARRVTEFPVWKLLVPTIVRLVPWTWITAVLDEYHAGRAPPVHDADADPVPPRLIDLVIDVIVQDAVVPPGDGLGEGLGDGEGDGLGDGEGVGVGAGPTVTLVLNVRVTPPPVAWTW